MYNNDAEACSYFTEIITARSKDTRGVASWGSGMPWIQVINQPSPVMPVCDVIYACNHVLLF